MGRTSLLAVVNDFPAPSQTFITRKLDGLRDAGLDVSVAATRFNDGAADPGLGRLPLAPWRDPSSVFDEVGRSGWRSLIRGAFGPTPTDSGPLNLRRKVALAPLAGARFDIVHFEFSGIAVSYRAVFERLRPARIVVSCRGAAEQIEPLTNPSRAADLADVFATVDLIHCVSQDMRRTVETLGAPSDKTFVNRPAVPVHEFAELGRDRPEHDGPLRVLSVGRLHWKKGLDDGIRAVGRARANADICYRIAGEGSEREKLTFLIDELGLRRNVELLGKRTVSEVQELLRWADVLLLPSLSEGISNAVLEAMAAGLPVVATRSGGMSEVITDGEDGFIVGVGDIGAMSSLLTTLSDRDVRMRIGRAAASRAAADFDISRQVRVFLDAYASTRT